MSLRRLSRNRLPRSVGSAAALSLVLLAPAVSAEARRVALRYEMDASLEGCPTRLEFRRNVVRQLGYDPFDDSAPQQVVATTQATRAGISGVVLWRDSDGQERGERRLLAEHRDCREFARSLAFAMVVQLELLEAPSQPEPDVRNAATATGAGVSTPEPEPARSERPNDESKPEPQNPVLLALVDSEPEPPSPPGPAPRWWFGIGAGGGVGSGFAPDPSALLRGFVTARRNNTSLEVGVTGSVPQKRAPEGFGFESHVLLATVAPCAHVQAFGACALAHFGELAVRGSGVLEPRSSRGAVSQLGVRFAYFVPLGPVTATVRAEALGALAQWTVEVDATEAWTLPRLALLAGLDLAFTTEHQP